MEEPGAENETVTRQVETTTEGQGLHREPLPELELRELRRSKEPIGAERGMNKMIGVLRPWHNYSIVILKNPDQIRIYDENGLEVSDFGELLSNPSVEINFSKILKASEKTFLGNNTKSSFNVLNVGDLPLLLRDFADKTLKDELQDGQWCLSANSLRLYKLSLKEPDVQIIKEGKYLMVGNKNEAPFIIFITENDSGIVQAPRNWKRIDITSPNSDVPQDLQQYIEEFRRLPGSYRDISNDKYAVLATDVGINIVGKNRINDTPLLSDNVPGIGQNICTDPSNQNILYYCRSNDPEGIIRLDLSPDPNTWGPVVAKLPEKYASINNLQLDPSGNFFLFYSQGDMVVITKDGLEEVKRVAGLSQVNFDSEGRIRAVDKDGHLVIYEPNFNELSQEMDKQRGTKLAKGIKIADIFELEASKKALGQKGGGGLEYLEPLQAQYEQQFTEVLAKITTPEGVHQLRQGFNKLADVLKQQGLKPNEVAFIISGLEGPIEIKEKEFAIKSTQEALVSVQATLASGLSIVSVSEARAEMERIRAVEGLLEEDLRQEV